MATSASPVVEQSGRNRPRRVFLRRTRHHVPTAVWYALAAFGVALFVVLVQLMFYLRRHEPRDARVIVERELKLNTLRPGERVVRTVVVFRRNGADYFRATRGLLVLTDRRLIYLGVPPRDITGASDSPPTFDQRDFRVDTLTKLEPTFTLLGFTRGIHINAPEGSLTLGVRPDAWPRAKLMREAWAVRQRKLRALGVWAARVRAARSQLQKDLDAYRHQPVYHVVRPGDAISSIASWYETSPQQIQELNGIVGTKIKVGQKLLIRSGS